MRSTIGHILAYVAFEAPRLRGIDKAKGSNSGLETSGS